MNRNALTPLLERSSFPSRFGAMLGAALLVFAVAALPESPSPAHQAPAAPSPVPQWQIDAGGKMSFDVASVRQDAVPPSASTQHSNIPLGPMDFFTPTGGYLSATDSPLLQYIVFAYKLMPEDAIRIRSQLPKWTSSDRFDIEARAAGNPTKDQFRLMMQSLLADRFKLSVHYEAKQLPVLAIVLDKPGVMGRQLRMHSNDSPCSSAPPALAAAMAFAATVPGGFPELCGAELPLQPSTTGRLRVGARNISMEAFARLLDSTPDMTRPVLDETGLRGNIDFVIEYTPTIGGSSSLGSDFQPDETGPTFVEALKDQLGLKLVPQMGTVSVLVIDHVEEPSPN